MAYCSQPIPDCNNPSVQDIYTSNNGTIDDCWFDRKKYISGRIYLAAAIFNGVGIILTTCLFVYSATATSESDKIPSLRFSARKIRQIWKRHTLQKRSVMGTMLGAIGHFIFSTGVLLGQAFSGPIGCEIYLWAVTIGFYTWMYALITRAYRLWFLFRINQYKVKYVRMSEEERLLCLDKKDYKWYLKNRNNIGNRLMRPYIIYVISILIMLAASIPVELIYFRNHHNCDLRRTAALLIAYFGFYVAFVVPCLLWFLRHNADFHGIRREIWIDAIIGIPYFILYITFFAVLSPSVLIVEIDGEISLFAPANWIVFFTAAAHIVSVVLPVLMYLPIQNRHWVNARDHFNYRCTLIKKPSSSNPTAFYHSGTMSPRSTPFLEIAKSDNSLDNLPNAPSSSEIPIKSKIELSIESLERCMTNPDIMQQLQDLAIRDFSSENLLFYETYLSLESKLKAVLAGTAQLSEASRGSNWMNSFLVKKRASEISTAGVLMKADSKGATAEDIEQQRNLQEFWETPIPYKMYPEFVQMYEYFIRENTPSQVNISYRARHVIDVKFWKLYRQYPEINPRLEQSSSTNNGAVPFFPPPVGRSIIIHDISNSKDAEIDGEEAIDKSNEKISTTTKCPTIQVTKNHEGDIPVLTMGLFEAARKEVCWNIFNSVYPKFVEMHNKLY